MVDDNLVTWVCIPFAVDVVDDVKDASIVVPELFAQSVPECHAVSGSKSLAFNSPDGNWLNPTPVKSQAHSQGRYLQVPELDSALFGLLHALLHDRNPSRSSSLMVNAQIPHHWYHRWFFISQHLLQFIVDMFVGANEGGLLCTDLEADLGELLMEVSIGFNCLPGHSFGILAGSVKADVINPAGEVDVLVLCMPGCQGRSEHCFGQEWSLWTSCWNAPADVKEGRHFLLGHDGFGTCVYLHGKFQHQGWIVDGLCLCLKCL